MQAVDGEMRILCVCCRQDHENMEDNMDKNKLHVVIGMAVASLGVICLGHVVSAGNDWSKQTEKPLAGLAVSFDKYCEDALQDMELGRRQKYLLRYRSRTRLRVWHRLTLLYSRPALPISLHRVRQYRRR